MSNVLVSPNTLMFETNSQSPNFGKLTRDGFLLIQSLTAAVNAATSDYVLLTAIQTLTNKTMDGVANTFTQIQTTSLKSKTGTAARVVTAAAAGTLGLQAQWDANGNLVDGIDPSNYATTAALTAAIAPLQTAGAIVTLPSYTVGTVPSASPAAQLVYVTDEIGGAVPAFSDATNWRRVTDRAIIS